MTLEPMCIGLFLLNIICDMNRHHLQFLSGKIGFFQCFEHNFLTCFDSLIDLYFYNYHMIFFYENYYWVLLRKKFLICYLSDFYYNKLNDFDY